MLKFLLILSFTLIGTAMSETTQPSFPVTIEVDASKPIGQLQPIWRFFGADEPNFAYMKDGKKLLGELGQIGKPTAYFRTHNLMTSGDGTPALKWGSTNMYTEDAAGNPIYNWEIVDRIFDAYIEAGMKPYVQIGFMPEAMSTKPQPYKHQWTPKLKYEEIFTGWAYPPKDYEKWGELVYQWTKHCMDKYGKAEVESWYWQTWNESNAGYWQGTPAEFYKLNDYAVAGVRRALPTAKVGGPEPAGNGGKWTRAFFEHALRGKNYATGEIGTPLDFLSFHAKGSPKHVDGHVRMGIANQLREIDGGFAIIASYPELKDKPIVIGESDPEGCAACQGPQFGYRNGTMYSSYTAASFTRKFELAEKHGVNLDGALTWAFEFEDQPYFAGFRVLATNGIDMPVLNVFRMFGKMTGERVETKSSHKVALDAILKDGVRGEADVAAFASADDKRISVMMWHYHDDDLPGPDAAVQLKLAGITAGSGDWKITEYRIDQDHSNAYATWKKLGLPASPTPDQYRQIETAGKLQSARTWSADLSKNQPMETTLPRQAVVLLVLEKI